MQQVSNPSFGKFGSSPLFVAAAAVFLVVRYLPRLFFGDQFYFLQENPIIPTAK